MNWVAKILSLIAMGLVVVPCALFFGGAIGLDTTKFLALSGTVIWFGATPIWMSRKSNSIEN